MTKQKKGSFKSDYSNPESIIINDSCLMIDVPVLELFAFLFMVEKVSL
jgi:hypothetical protein